MATETPVSVPDGGMRVFVEGRVVQNGEEAVRVLVRNEGDRAFRIGLLEIVTAVGTGIDGASVLEAPGFPTEKLLQPGAEQVFTIVLSYIGDGGFTVEFRIPASPFDDGYYSATINGMISYLAPVSGIPDLDVSLYATENGVLIHDAPVADGGSIDITSSGFGPVNILLGVPHTTWRLRNNGSADLTISAINLTGTSGTGSFPTPNTNPVLSPDPGFPLVIPAGGFVDVGVDHQQDALGTAPSDMMSIDSDDPDEDPYNFGMPIEFFAII